MSGKFSWLEDSLILSEGTLRVLNHWLLRVSTPSPTAGLTCLKATKGIREFPTPTANAYCASETLWSFELGGIMSSHMGWP